MKREQDEPIHHATDIPERRQRGPNDGPTVGPTCTERSSENTRKPGHDRVVLEAPTRTGSLKGHLPTIAMAANPASDSMCGMKRLTMPSASLDT